MKRYVFKDEVPLKFTKNGQAYDPGSILICRNEDEVKTAQNLGEPAILYKGNKDSFTKLIIYPFLCQKFPGIKWEQVLHLPKNREYYMYDVPGNDEADDSFVGFGDDVEGSDHATSDRVFARQGKLGDIDTIKCDIANTWNCDFQVDIKKLMDMDMLPKFIKNITEAVYGQHDDVHWNAGWNKKLRMCCGNWSDQCQADNLIIIDCSYSIPRGVSSSMLALADALRENFKADLILTAAASKFWEYGEPLPAPQELRNLIPLGQESEMFHEILNENIAGKVYDNVIVFGDYDRPCRIRPWEPGFGLNAATCDNRILNDPPKVGKLWSFRVDKWGDANEQPVGYAQWVKELGLDYEYYQDSTEWCKCMRK